MESIIDAYCGAWNENDGARRHAILSAVFHENGVYTDPTVHAVGCRQLNDHISVVCRKYPGSTIVRTSVIDFHHNVARFHWKKVLSDGTSMPEGLDVVEFREATITKIFGFFGPISPAADELPTICMNHERVTS